MPIDELLTATRDVPEPSAEAVDLARRKTMHEASASVGRILRLSRKRSRRRRIGYATIATAACAALLVVGLRLDGPAPTAPRAAPETVTPTHTKPTVESPKFTNAAQVFTAAAQSTSPDPTAGAYWRVDAQYKQNDDAVETRTVWRQRNGESMLYDTGVDANNLVSLGATKFSLEQRTLTWDQLMALPTDTTSLLAALRGNTAQLRGKPDHYAFKTVGELLMDSPAPQRLRSALWDAAAKLDGVRLTGRTTDATGRTGWGITDGQITYVVAPETGSILEYRIAGPGTDYRMTYLDRGPTDVAPKVGPAPLSH